MKSSFLALLGLLGLLALTVGISFVPLGPLNLALAMTIAFAQTALIVGVFTEWRQGDVPTRLALVVGFVWLAIFLILAGADFGVRPAGTLLLR